MSDGTARLIDSQTILTLTAEIVAAHAGNTTMSPAELSETIGAVSRALRSVGTWSVEPEKKELVPAVPLKKSVTPDYVICLEDGKKLRMLKRHLMSTYNMTPDDYRAKWQLPRDYPMVAPNYAATRSALAKKTGLGRPKAAAPAAAPAPQAPAVPAAAAKPALRRRAPKKARA